ncbi:expressed unknown protein [Seminavis robusta]|uniref:MYND-type domain-containing protein n=1 Tax=Seminavis robusta TaxID=568900 RepID=A0A9N8DRK0_9STRA|nr:expressed unknown protein [Seminavis robusta]|eukprot:Sro238_g095500.1 n/a (601) ;mRNA; f:25807-27609
MSTTTCTSNKQRTDAIATLISFYKNKYSSSSNNAFFVHDSIEYYSDEQTGVGVRARQDIPQGTTVLKVPDAERVSLSNVPTWMTSKKAKAALTKVQDDYLQVQQTFVSGIGCLGDIYPYGETCLTVCVLHLLAAANQHKFDHITQAWPTVEEFETYCYPIWFPDYHSPEFRQLIEGTATLDYIDRHAKALRHAFDTVVLPNITATCSKEFLPQAFHNTNQSTTENLWTAFRYASSLVRSRSHEGKIAGECDIIPIVDLTNGMPSYCTQKLNVEYKSGSETVGKNKKKTPVTCIVTIKDIPAGTELLLSYGNVHASHFAIRYGCFPPDIVHDREGSLDFVTLHVPPSLAPTDQMRAGACRKASLPSTKQQIEQFFNLGCHYDALEPFRQQSQSTSTEVTISEPLARLQKFFILCHLLNEEALPTFLSTGRLPTNRSWSLQLEGQLHLSVLDYTLEKVTTLNFSTNEEDLDKAANHHASRNDLVAAYHTRICQRDSLAQWRHAVCQRYQYPSEHVLSEVQFQTAVAQLVSSMGNTQNESSQIPRSEAPQCILRSRGCPVCGRTLNLKACSRCKQVKYCCKDHQLVGWKKLGHKRECNPSLAS